MPRLIFTFETLFQVLAAEKNLRTVIKCRTVPTPSGLSTDICGIALEIFEEADKEAAATALRASSLTPKGIHLVY
ncbi:MAG: DUF3343 domain-containing protein [Candidatus Obscuribacterales bacterium]|nr:DUF3343 domain-containing protein [Candidatus Obscuribacterales bacterium]